MIIINRPGITEQDERRAYGIGKDSYTTGEDLDTILDWACAEGILPDNAGIDLAARRGWEAARMAA